MGNENCKLEDLYIDKAIVESNDFWTLYDGIASTTTNDDGKQYLSIFQGESVVNGQLWFYQGPMERVIRNLMIYRHPYILKYVTNWQQGGKKYLATERVQPLSAVLTYQSDIQICLGLRTILCGLIFLVEKALARHLNICVQSIYVTDEGNWRLSGFEFVWKMQDINKKLLDLVRSYRYKNAIDSCEESIEGTEQYAFATLCDEIFNYAATLNQQPPTEHEEQFNGVPCTPYAKDFREYCSEHLKHKNTQMRPKLSAILLHPYFNHEFVLIHAFLFELPLKSNHEKKDFFLGLIDRLRGFDENIVASQFANDLLSRMVLLDSTAQLCVTPYILRSKAQHSTALFTINCYRQYLLPVILKMFRIRDAQIRLILLEYFTDYVQLMTPKDVHEYILPHLKVGLNDTNELLVAKTLHALAELIPILGATIVLECDRVKLFSDGRPLATTTDTIQHWMEPRSITPVLAENTIDIDCVIVSGSPSLAVPSDELMNNKSGSTSSLSQTFNTETFEHCMLRRLSPDGGEDVKSPLNVDVTAPNKVLNLDERGEILSDTQELDDRIINKLDKEEAWSDWDNEIPLTQQQQQQEPLNCDEELSKLEDKNVSVFNIPNESKGKSDNKLNITNSQKDGILHVIHSPASSQCSLSTKQNPHPVKLQTINDDFSQLDIQIKKRNCVLSGNVEENELDFFKGMEPIIESCKNYYLKIPDGQCKSERITNYKRPEDDLFVDSTRFAPVLTANDEVVGWCIDEDLDIPSTST